MGRSRIPCWSDEAGGATVLYADTNLWEIFTCGPRYHEPVGGRSLDALASLYCPLLLLSPRKLPVADFFCEPLSVHKNAFHCQGIVQGTFRNPLVF